MSASDIDCSSDAPASAPASAPGSTLGRCKWFDEKKGYGFIIVCEGPAAESEVFVHYKDIKSLVNTHRTLRKGEYVHMHLDDAKERHKPQARNVTGVNGGPLMCDHFVRRSLEISESDSAELRLRMEGRACA